MFDKSCNETSCQNIGLYTKITTYYVSVYLYVDICVYRPEHVFYIKKEPAVFWNDRHCKGGPRLILLKSPNYCKYTQTEKLALTLPISHTVERYNSFQASLNVLLSFEQLAGRTSSHPAVCYYSSS